MSACAVGAKRSRNVDAMRWWWFLIAAVFVLPVALFIRHAVRPGIVWGVNAAKGFFARAGLEARFASAVRALASHPAWLRALVWLGGLEWYTAIALVIAVAVTLSALSMWCTERLCPPHKPSAGRGKYNPVWQPARQAATDKPGESAGQQGGRPAQRGSLGLDPAQAAQWDGEMESVTAELRSIEAELRRLGVQLSPEAAAAAEPGSSRDSSGESALPPSRGGAPEPTLRRRGQTASQSPGHPLG